MLKFFLPSLLCGGWGKEEDRSMYTLLSSRLSLSNIDSMSVYIISITFLSTLSIFTPFCQTHLVWPSPGAMYCLLTLNLRQCGWAQAAVGRRRRYITRWIRTAYTFIPDQQPHYISGVWISLYPCFHSYFQCLNTLPPCSLPHPWIIILYIAEKMKIIKWELPSLFHYKIYDSFCSYHLFLTLFYNECDPPPI